MNDIRGDIEKAMETLSTGETTATEAPAPVETTPTPATVEAAAEEVPTTETAEAAAQRARDEKGRFAPGKVESKPAATVKPTPAVAKATPAPKPAVASATPAPVPPVVTPTEPEIKPPPQWRAMAREHWGKVPREVRDEIVRRESEVTKKLQESAEAAKGYEAFRGAVAPYEGMLRTEGAEPVAAVQSLLKTYAMLRGPNAPAVVANIIRSLNIPVDALAQALDNPQAPPPAPQPQEFRDPRLDALLEREEMAQKARVKAELDEFLSSEPEFISDVAPVAQALLASGVAKNFKDAYDRACWADDSIRAILQQREASKAANAKLASTQQALNAGSSVKGQPAAVSPAPGGNGSIRDDLLAAMAAHGRR